MGNREKYQCRNPAQRFLIERFLRRAVALAGRGPHATILDAGCGEGFVTEALRRGLPAARFITGLELMPDAARDYRDAHPECGAVRGDLGRLPFADRSVDLVVATEVLEHLTRPGPALAELMRVTRGRILLSVPREPLFAGLNLLRAKNVRRLGSDADHKQHWSRTAFLRWIHAPLRVLAAPQDTPPWTLVLAEVRR